MSFQFSFIFFVFCPIILMVQILAQNGNFQAKLMAYSAPFYNRLTPDEKQQFLDIYLNTNSSKQQTIQQMIQFAQHLPLDIQIQFSIWGKQLQDVTKATDDYAKTLSISQLAQPYAIQIMSTYSDPNIGYNNENSQLEQILDNAPDTVKNELALYIMNLMAKFSEFWIQATGVNVNENSN